jgi:hypothetical protein
VVTTVSEFVRMSARVWELICRSFSFLAINTERETHAVFWTEYPIKSNAFVICYREDGPFA